MVRVRNIEAIFLGKQLLHFDSTLAQCNISNLDRISVFPCRPFAIGVAVIVGPDTGPIVSSINVNEFESVASLKKKIFDKIDHPPEKLLVHCGDRWLSPADDQSCLMDMRIIPQTCHNLVGMAWVLVTAYRHVRPNNQKFEISVKVPQDKLQFRIAVSPTDTISNVKAMILQKSSFCVETHMLIFNDKNILEDGYAALLDYDIKKDAQLVLCEKGSFVVWVSKKESDHRFIIEVDSLDTIDILKTKIQRITGSVPEERTLFHEGNKGWEAMFKGSLVRYGIVKLSNPKVPVFLISYSDDNPEMKIYTRKYRREENENYAPKIPLSFWEKMSSSASAGVPIEDFLMQVNSQFNVQASIKVHVLVSLSESLIFRMMFMVGFGETLKSFKNKISAQAKFYKEIDYLTYIQQGNYVLLLNKQILEDDESSTLEHCGINDDSEILLCPKAPFTVRICIPSSIHGNEIYEDVLVNCLDTVQSLKEKMIARMGSHLEFMELCYNESQLSGERLLVHYGIVSHHVASVGLGWEHTEIRLKVIIDKGRTASHD